MKFHNHGSVAEHFLSSRQRCTRPSPDWHYPWHAPPDNRGSMQPSQSYVHIPGRTLPPPHTPVQPRSQRRFPQVHRSHLSSQARQVGCTSCAPHWPVSQGQRDVRAANGHYPQQSWLAHTSNNLRCWGAQTTRVHVTQKCPTPHLHPLTDTARQSNGSACAYLGLPIRQQRPGIHTRASTRYEIHCRRQLQPSHTR